MLWFMQMTIPPDIETWARSQVTSGRYATVEDAITDAVRSRALRDDDLHWARPLLDVARQQASAGGIVTRSAVTQAMREAIERHNRDG